MRPFHLALPVTDLEATRHFYVEIIGCELGRESPRKWIDFDIFGNQMSAHLHESSLANVACGDVDGDAVPVPHFGVVMTPGEFKILSQRLIDYPKTDWVLHPRTRFANQPGEQSTLFIRDPSGNALEFKAFAEDSAIFAQ